MIGWQRGCIGNKVFGKEMIYDWNSVEMLDMELMLLNCGIRRLLRVPWTARISNQSILKDISSEYSLEGVMLKLNLQYFGHLM